MLWRRSKSSEGGEIPTDIYVGETTSGRKFETLTVKPKKKSGPTPVQGQLTMDAFLNQGVIPKLQSPAIRPRILLAGFGATGILSQHSPSNITDNPDQNQQTSSQEKTSQTVDAQHTEAHHASTKNAEAPEDNTGVGVTSVDASTQEKHLTTFLIGKLS